MAISPECLDVRSGAELWGRVAAADSGDGLGCSYKAGGLGSVPHK